MAKRNTTTTTMSMIANTNDVTLTELASRFVSAREGGMLEHYQNLAQYADRHKLDTEEKINTALDAALAGLNSTPDKSAKSKMKAALTAGARFAPALAEAREVQPTLREAGSTTAVQEVALSIARAMASKDGYQRDVFVSARVNKRREAAEKAAAREADPVTMELIGIATKLDKLAKSKKTPPSVLNTVRAALGALSDYLPSEAEKPKPAPKPAPAPAPVAAPDIDPIANLFNSPAFQAGMMNMIQQVMKK